MHKKIYKAFLVIIVILTSCETERLAPDINKIGLSYFPLEKGNFRIYEVEEINFSFVEGSDTARYQMKETISDFYINQQSDTTYVLHRFTREGTENNWQLDSVWTALKNTNQLVVVENNVPVVRLAFPVKEGLVWDGNALNTLERDDFIIQNLSQPFEIASELFFNTVTVLENDNQDTIIFQDYRTSIYAEGVGLINRESSVLNYCATDVECLGKGIVESGRKFKQQIIDHGKE